jgi:nucleoside-diphosphate-sugar epimerase
VVVHGDGSSLWTMTHHDDFARGFNGLLGNLHAIGETFHITSDEWLTWDQIHHIFARAAGVEKPHLVHIPSELINAYDANWGASLLGDKTHSSIFDNSKIKRVVPGFRAQIPFSRGAEEIMAWYDENHARQKMDEKIDRLMDKMIMDLQAIWPTEQAVVL